MSKCKLALNAILVLLLLLPFAHAAVSEEQVQSVGGSSLTDAMPNSARQYLDGVSPENADTLSDSVSRVLENMTSDSQSAIRTALGGLLRVAVIVLLASAARGFSAAAGGEANDWIDQNELLRRLAAQAGGDAALERLSGALGTADGRRAVEQLSAQHADELEQAAKAAQRGDMRSAAQAAQKLMQTPEGARLAAQLRHIFGK